MNGLTSIEINGKTVGLKFGLEANRIYLEYIAGNLERIGRKIYNEKDTATLIYAGYVNFCTVNDLIPDPAYSVGKLIGWIEDSDDSIIPEIERIAKVYADSKHTKQTTKNLNNAVDDIKKKTTQTGSSLNLSATESLASEAIESLQT